MRFAKVRINSISLSKK